MNPGPPRLARALLAALAALVGRAPPKAAPRRAAEPKVLRYAFDVAETGFDPAQVNDLYSRTVTPHIFEAPLHLRPPGAADQARPLTAAAMPEHRPTSGSGPCASARHLLRRRPGVQGREARARRAGLRLFLQAHFDPAKSPANL